MRAVIFADGRPSGELEPGFYLQDGFLQRLFGGDVQGDQASVVLAYSEPFIIPFSTGDLRPKDSPAVEISLRIALQLRSISDLAARCLASRDQLTIDHLSSAMSDPIRRALRPAVGAMTLEEIVSESALEQRLGNATDASLNQDAALFGYRFLSVEFAEVTGRAVDQQREREVERLMENLERSQAMDEIRSQADLREFIRGIEHQHSLTEFDHAEIERIWRIQSNQRIRAVEREGEREEGDFEREEELKEVENAYKMHQRHLDLERQEMELQAKVGAMPTEKAPASGHRASVGVAFVSAGNEVKPLGTVWQVAPNLVATNAHVANRINKKRKEGSPAWVRFPDAPDGQRLEILRVRTHPQYDKKLDAITGSAVPAYDVAVMKIEGSLAPSLPLASLDTCQQLLEGMNVSYWGYPNEGLAGETSELAPAPVFQDGRITRLSDWNLNAVDPADAQLITHNAGVAGGASGSPLMNDRGEVVGMVSAGSMHVVPLEEEGKQQRIPSGAGVNFGIRIDVLFDLLSDD